MITLQGAARLPPPIDSRYTARNVPSAAARAKVRDSFSPVLHRLQKAYDTVDGKLPRDMLAHVAVPEKMKMLSYSSRRHARMRLDDNDYSERFIVEQGLHQGCVLAPLRFKLFLVAVLKVALQLYPEILTDLAPLHEQASEGRTEGSDESKDRDKGSLRSWMSPSSIGRVSV